MTEGDANPGYDPDGGGEPGYDPDGGYNYNAESATI